MGVDNLGYCLSSGMRECLTPGISSLFILRDVYDLAPIILMSQIMLNDCVFRIAKDKSKV